jgi:hypothetical protein
MGDNDDDDDGGDGDDVDITIESSMGGDAIDEEEDLVEGEVDEEKHIRWLIPSVLLNSTCCCLYCLESNCKLRRQKTNGGRKRCLDTDWKSEDGDDIFTH